VTGGISGEVRELGKTPRKGQTIHAEQSCSEVLVRGPHALRGEGGDSVESQKKKHSRDLSEGPWVYIHEGLKTIAALQDDLHHSSPVIKKEVRKKPWLQGDPEHGLVQGVKKPI